MQSNARQGIFCKCGTDICEIIWNSRMKHQTRPCQTRSLWTRLCGAKLRPALPNHHVKSLLYWDIMQCQMAVPFWCFRTTYWPHLQTSRNPKREHSTTEVNWQSSFLGLNILPNFLRKHNVLEACSISIYR